MAGFAFKTSGDQQPTEGVRKAVADHGSKTVMLTAERRDEIVISKVKERFQEEETIPSSLKIIQRTNTFYGPKLIAQDEFQDDFLLTAPGPDANLHIWNEATSPEGGREGWKKLAEVQAELRDSQNRYHLCPECQQPLNDAEHERLAAIGRCPNV